MTPDQKANVKLHEGIWKIERYGVCETEGWNEDSPVDSRIYLILKNLTLMVMSNDTVVDIIHLTNNVRMVLKNDTLGIAVTHAEKKMRKVRLKFADTYSYSGLLVARSCAAMLRKYVQVEDLNPKATFGNNTFNSDEKPLRIRLQEHVSQLMEKKVTEFYSGDEEFSSVYPLEDMIEICILDKDFPSFVAEVNDTLLKKLKKINGNTL